MKIAFTGHRHLKYKDAVSKLESIHVKYPDAIWITGGAIGLGFAISHGIRLWLILPFSQDVMSLKWNASQKAFPAESVKYASKLSVLSPMFATQTYQDRNIRMVQLSDILAAFFDGSRGGTANCVNYARSICHPIEMCL